MHQRWPEGPHADPDAARARYNAGVRESRRSVRDFFRTDMPAAHLGAAVTVFACVLAGVAWSPAAAMIVAGVFAALFTVALTVGRLTGRRGRNAVRTAYKVTFGWTSWV